MKNGTVYNKGFESPDEDVANDPEVENGDGRSSPKRYGTLMRSATAARIAAKPPKYRQR